MANRIARPAALAAVIVVSVLAGCGKEAPKGAGERPPVDVTAITVAARDVPIGFEFVGQTQSSREVEIRARVDGFLEKRLYTEGDVVKSGQALFQVDTKPFDASLQTARGQLAQNQAQLDVAVANLARVRPLAEQNAVSKKDLDDAIGNEQKARAAVIGAQGDVQTKELNLGYTTIVSPLTGLSSFAKVQEGTYLSTQNSLLTTVAQLDPIWVNFSISENETLRYRDQAARGLLRLPKDGNFAVEVVLADGTLFPNRGHISFADPSFSKETGTFLVRAVLANGGAQLRPGQFVRVRVLGAVRPNAILVPQRAVQQGAKSHFVWLVGKDGKAAQRPVDVGEWNGDDWFINAGLATGDQVVVDGAIRVGPGATLKATPYVAPPVAVTERKAAGVTSVEADLAGMPPAGKAAAAARDTANAAASAKAPGAGSASVKAPAAAPPPPATAAAPTAAASSPAAAGPAAATAQAADPFGANVFFDADSDVLSTEGAAALAPVARALAAAPTAKVVVTGYADKTGAPGRNVQLAKDRAKAVRAALIGQGARPGQTELRPPAAVTGGDDDRRARRVDVAPAP